MFIVFFYYKKRLLVVNKCYLLEFFYEDVGVRDKWGAFFETFVPKGQNGCFCGHFAEKFKAA